VWDFPFAGRAGPPPGELAAADLEALWGELGGADAARAYQAILKLASGAGKAVPFLAKHLRPVPRLEGDRVGNLIEDLGSTRSAARQQATAELEKLGEPAELALRKALKRPLAPEVQIRVRRLLERMNANAASVRLRLTRALEALERAGTPEARRL